ncbi:MAG: penicillin acylase family protein [Anaerolineae bacterium]|nr:penicillin acylase family protein [Anaerolineae bacterium]
MNALKFILRLLLGRRLPVTSGTLQVSGLKRPLVIRRDGYGVPYIEAKTDEDAWYGIGFCHGQERAFQLESQLRVMRGTVAEMAGAAALPVDRLSRRIGFYRAAEQQLAVLDDEFRRMLAAYARGVNAGVRAGGGKAHEFALLRTQPTPYTAAAVLGVLKLMGFMIATNWDCELMRLKMLQDDGPEALVALDPAYPEWLPVTAPPMGIAGRALDRLAQDLAAFSEASHVGGGSNTWVMDASRTATGRPILAFDPHMDAVLPTMFYLIQVRTPDWGLVGASLPGTPFFGAGHNGFFAWGISSGMTDTTDLFVEQIGPDGQSVREGDHFVPCLVRREVIRVKGGDPVTEEVLITPRGPVIGPALDEDLGAISLSATWLRPQPFAGFAKFHLVHSFAEFRQAFESWPFLPINFSYADTSGNIGWQLVGDAPRRRKGWGTMPMAGWDPEVGWEETPVPFDRMPHVFNPDCGFVVSANNAPQPAGEGPFLGVDWIHGYRAAAIAEGIGARRDWDVAAVQKSQLNQKSMPWVELRDAVLAAPSENAAARQALDLLRAWDGVVSDDSAAAAVYELFLAEMLRRVVVAKAPKTARWGLGASFTPLFPRSYMSQQRTGHLVSLLREQPAGWFDRPWNVELAESLAAAVTALRQRRGDDPRNWAWGSVRTLTFVHPVGVKAPLDRVFNLGPLPGGGDSNTSAQASVDLLDPTANPLLVARLRMVIDVGNWEESRFAMPGGESGNPFSPHYGDQLSLWQHGDGFPIAWSPEKVAQATREVLRLTPEPG